MQTETYSFKTVSSLLGEYQVIRRSDGKDLGTVRRDATVGRDAWRAVTPETSNWQEGSPRTGRFLAAVALDAQDRAQALVFAAGDQVMYENSLGRRVSTSVIAQNGEKLTVEHRGGEKEISLSAVARVMERNGLSVYTQS